MDSKFPTKPACGEIDPFAIAADAFLHATEIIRYNNFYRSVNMVERVFSVVTGNDYLLEKCYVCQRSVLSEYRQEMNMFIQDRYTFLVNSMIKHIEQRYDFKANHIVEAKLIIGGRPIEYHSTKSLRDWQLLEHDILNDCAIFAQAAQIENHNDEYSRLIAGSEVNIQKLLWFLVGTFRYYMSGWVKMSKVRPSVEQDFDSFELIALVGHLIAKVVSCSIKVEQPYDQECLKQARYSLIKDDLFTYSNLGSMNYSCILCCFKNVKVLSAGVSNTDGYLNQDEKTFLYDILTLSKLL